MGKIIGWIELVMGVVSLLIYVLSWIGALSQPGEIAILEDVLYLFVGLIAIFAALPNLKKT